LPRKSPRKNKGVLPSYYKDFYMGWFVCFLRKIDILIFSRSICLWFIFQIESFLL
jgi:hypothetical protein